MIKSDISSKKLQAACLEARGLPLSQIADQLSIHKRTLLRWKKDPEYQKARQENLDATREAIAETSISHTKAQLEGVYSWSQKQQVIKSELAMLDRCTNLAVEVLEQERDLRAIDRILRVQERRAKLLGLDAIQYADVLQSAIALAQLGLLSDSKLDGIFQIYDELPRRLSAVADR